MAALVFLSGLPLPAAMFDATATALSGEHEVRLVDYPGFGGTALPDGLSFDDYVTAVDAAIGDPDAPVVLVGLSFGAQVALALTMRQPAKVAALVLSNTQGGPPTDQERGMFTEAAGAAEARGTAALTEMLSGMLLATETLEGRPEVCAQVAELIASTPGPAAASAFRALAQRPEPGTLLPHVKVPVFLVFGAGDKATSPDDAKALAAGLPQASVHLIPDAGHFPPLETPDEYVTAVRGFLAGLT